MQRPPHLLRCTAQQAGERFRISVHLLDGTSGLELWAKRFDGTISEVFKAGLPE